VLSAFALELYAPRQSDDLFATAVARVTAVTDEMRREGAAVRYLRSVFLRGDEIGFLLFEGPSQDAVAEAARRAAITFERVLEIDLSPDEPSHHTVKPLEAVRKGRR
jgi:hypothetical protein